MNKDDQNQMSTVFCMMAIGAIESIRNGSLSIDEAERFIFSAFINEDLKKIGISKDVTDLIQDGTELEDIQSLLPGNLNNKLSDMLTKSLDIIKGLPKENTQLPTWFSKLSIWKDIDKT